MENANDNNADLAGLTPVQIVVSEKEFNQLQEWLDKPAVLKPELVKLFATDFSHLFS